MTRMSRQQAEDFYAIHRGKPFFENLVEFMSSGPIFVMILKHKNAVEEFRKLIGATDPEKAEPDNKKAVRRICYNECHSWIRQ